MQTTGTLNAPKGLASRSRAAKRVQVVRHATASKPVWTGDSIPSRIANWAINTPWIYSGLKFLAKNEMKSTAAKKGVPWDEHVQRLQATPEMQAIKEELERKDIVYPDYYLKPFHGYDTGNLSWLAAFEVEPASYAVALRAFGKIHPNITPEAAYRRMVSGATDAIKDYCSKHGIPTERRTILDVGCSAGLSTRWVASQFPDAEMTGMDLSPYFLSVAEYEERKRGGSFPDGRRIRYVHDRIETSTLFGPSSVDWMLFQYVIHECPQQTIQDFVSKAAEVVKPGGLLVFVDNNPQSKTIQGLPPAVATLMKSTEPWSDEYYSFDVEAGMRRGGFTDVVTVEIDHRHRAVMGRKV